MSVNGSFDAPNGVVFQRNGGFEGEVFAGLGLGFRGLGLGLGLGVWGLWFGF